MKLFHRVTLAIALVASVSALTIAPAQAAVSTDPAPTPQLGTSGTDGSVEEVRQFARCNGVMYAVGRFTQVKNPGSSTLIARNNAFAFSASAPYAITAWNPNLNGQVDTVACAPDGNILLGGSFTTVGGAATKFITKVHPTTGARLPFSFAPQARVEHIEVIGGHLIVGGRFAGYLDSRNPTTGADDGYGVPSISGTYVYTGAAPNTTRVYNMTQNPAGTSLVIAGVFTQVGGQRHEQLARLDLTASGLQVNSWHPAELDINGTWHCGSKQPFFAQDAAWVGDTIYTATTGYRLPDNPPTEAPREGPCDAVIAFPATNTNGVAVAKWHNYTGCDSLLSVAADSTTVYAAGHQRWANNENGCDFKGPGAVAAPGLGFFDPVTGRYIAAGESRGRGVGATELLRLVGGAGAGLWIGSDNAQNTASCGGEGGHMGICYLPG